VRARLAALPAGGFCQEEERQFALRFAPYSFGATDDPRREAFQELRETAVEEPRPGAAPYRAGAGDLVRTVLAELASRGALSCTAMPSEAAGKGVKCEQGEGGGGRVNGSLGHFGAFEFAVRLSGRVVAGVAGLDAGDEVEVDWVGQVRLHAQEEFDACVGAWAAQEALQAGPGVPYRSSLCRAVWEGFFGARVCPDRGVPLPPGLQERQGRASWHRAEVLDPAGVTLGSLSQSDVLAHVVSKGMSLGAMFFMPLRELAGQAGSLHGGWGRLLTERSSLVVVDADMPLAYALHLLGRAGAECAAVLDRQGGELVGTLSPKSLRFFQAGHESVLALPVGLFLAQVFSRGYGKHHPRLAVGGPAAEPFFAAHARESRSVLCGTVPAVAEGEPLLAAMEVMLAQRERCCWLKGEGGELSGALFLPDLLRFLCSCPLREVTL
jgi:CBS domain-containing protein